MHSVISFDFMIFYYNSHIRTYNVPVILSIEIQVPQNLLLLYHQYPLNITTGTWCTCGNAFMKECHNLKEVLSFLCPNQWLLNHIVLFRWGLISVIWLNKRQNQSFKSFPCCCPLKPLQQSALLKASVSDIVAYRSLSSLEIKHYAFRAINVMTTWLYRISPESLQSCGGRGFSVALFHMTRNWTGISKPQGSER